MVKKSFLKDLFQASMLNKLLIINIFIYLLISIADVLCYLIVPPNTDYISALTVKYFAVPAYGWNLLTRFWTPFTYMFLHVNFWHIFGNMLWLFFMGRMFTQLLTNKHLFGVYVLGGFSGALLYILSYNIFPVFSQVLPMSLCFGASASVTAIVISVAVLRPDERVYFFGIFPIALKWLALFYVVYDLMQLSGDNAGGHFAHLGGAVFGAIFGWQMRQGKDLTKGFNKIIDSIVSLFSFSGKRGMRVVYRNSNAKTSDTSRMSDAQYNQYKAKEQQRMDEILDKISKSGYTSLTSEEKEFLYKMSKK